MGRLAKTIFVFICVALIQARADTVLVLPFFNLSNSANLDWIGESFAETIRESLAGQGVLALSREDRQEAFRRLSIRPYALLTRASLSITCRILDLKRIKQGPELTELGAIEDLAAIQTHLAWQAVQALAPKTAP